jgi:hypothetical protein
MLKPVCMPMTKNDASIDTLNPDGIYLIAAVRACSRRPLLAWCAIGSTLSLVVLLSLLLGHIPLPVAAALLLQVIAMLLTAIGMRVAAAIFSEWQKFIPGFLRTDDLQRLQQWLMRENQVFYKSRTAVCFALGFALLAACTYTWGCRMYIGSHPLVMYLVPATLLLTGFVAGIAIANIFFFSRFVWRLGLFPIKVSQHSFGPLSTGHTMSILYLIAAGVWVCYTISAIWLEDSWIPMLAHALPSLILFISSFVICQIPMHLRMLDHKRSEIMAIESLLNELEPGEPDELTKERSAKLEYYKAKLGEAMDLPEWPFQFSQLATISVSGFTAVGAPIAISLLERVIPDFL